MLNFWLIFMQITFMQNTFKKSMEEKKKDATHWIYRVWVWTGRQDKEGNKRS